MAEIKVKVDLDKLNVLITSINEKAVKSAVRASINRTFTGIRSSIMKELNQGDFYDKKKLPTSKAKQRYFFEKKKLSASTELSDMYASMGISNNRINLINFFAKRVLVGFTNRPLPIKLKSGQWITLKQGHPLFGAEVKMFGKKRVYKGDFIGNIGKSNEQVFRRKENGKVFRRTGPSMSLLFEKTNAAQRIQNEADERMQRELEHNLGYYLSKI